MRRTTILAWALSLTCIVLSTAQLIYSLRAPGYTPTPFDLVEKFGWGWAVPITFSLTAAAIITRQPGNRVGWLLMLPALVTATAPDQVLATPRTVLTPALWLVLWASTWSWMPVIFPVLLLPLNFPTGKPPTPRWRWINWLAIGMWLLFMLLVAISPDIGPANYDWRLPNPLGIAPRGLVDTLLGPLWVAGLLAITLGSIVSLVVRYRRADMVEKEQIKWVLYAAAMMGLIYTLNIAVGDQTPSALANLLLVLGILAFPIAIAIAILRYRLFDIDVIIRKTVLYGALTLLLAVIYFGAVFVLSALLRTISGGESPLVLVISTLLIAALFMPLRRRLQAAIDRRFYRRQYDAQQVLGAFAQTARDEVELQSLAALLLQTVNETMEPQTAVLWLPQKD